MKSLLNIIALLLVVQSSCFGANLVLRERATQRGSVIRLGDIADISAAHPAELQDLVNLTLMPTPAAGTRQFLTVSQVRELLASRGVSWSRHRITGSQIVEIGEAAVLPKKTSSPITAKLPEDLQADVAQLIEQHLIQQTGHSDWRVELLISDHAIQKIESLGANTHIRTTRKPRSGRERFILSNGKEPSITVAANVTKINSVVVIKRRLERGQLIGVSDVAIETREGNLPSTVFNDLSQVIGKEAQRTFRPEEILQANQIRAPWQVRRGEIVNAYVRTGGIVVRTRAIAKQDGAMGELITLETLEDKQRLHASVTGPGEVTVYAAGGRATDFAMKYSSGLQSK